MANFYSFGVRFTPKKRISSLLFWSESHPKYEISLKKKSENLPLLFKRANVFTLFQ